MVRYIVAPVGRPLVQEPVPLLQQAGDQDRDWDLLLQCPIDLVVVNITAYFNFLP